MRALRVPVEGKPEVIEIDHNDLVALHKEVGGYIETIPLRARLGLGVINEEGKIFNLPENRLATSLADVMPGDYIAGPMLVFGPRIEDSEFTPVEDKILEVVKVA